jgi:dephospho-CoA kinase
MRVIGLTGNIASGKSAVATLLAERGVPIIDADVLAREAVKPFTPGHAAIIERWGPQVVASDGSIDRAALRRIAFADPAQLAALNAIVHPEVLRRRTALVEVARAQGERIIVCDIPLLFEAGLVSDVDAVLLIDAPEAMRRDRLVRDRALSPEEATAMIRAQMPAELKRSRADYIIDNTGSPEELRNRLDEVWSRIDAET